MMHEGSDIKFTLARLLRWAIDLILAHKKEYSEAGVIVVSFTAKTAPGSIIEILTISYLKFLVSYRSNLLLFITNSQSYNYKLYFFFSVWRKILCSFFKVV